LLSAVNREEEWVSGSAILLFQMAAGIFGKTWQSNTKKLGLDESFTTILLLRYQELVI